MPVDIKRFMAVQNKVGGVARPSHFAVEISTPRTQSFDTTTNEALTFLCESVTLPTRRLMTDDSYASHGYGMIQKMPWGIDTGGSLSLTFMADNCGYVKQALYTLLQSAIPHNEDSQLKHSAAFPDSLQYTVRYPVQYQGTVKVFTYDPVGKLVTTYIFYNAYIASVGSLTYSADSTSYVRIPATINYSRLRVEISAATRAATAVGATNTSLSSTIAGNVLDRIGVGGLGDALFKKATSALASQLDIGVNNALNRLQQQVPPELQGVYARAVPLLGGLNNFRF